MDVNLAKRLCDAHRAALKIEAITEGMDFGDYESVEVTRLAVELRNRIIHGDDDINDVVIWDIVQTNLPSLRNQLETLLNEVSQGQPS